MLLSIIARQSSAAGVASVAATTSTITSTAIVSVGNSSLRANKRTSGGGCTDVLAAQLANLSGLKVKAFFESDPTTRVHHIAGGAINSKIRDSIYAVSLENIHLSPIIEVGSRVYVEYGCDETNAGTVQGGIVVHINGNGTLGVMLDNNSFVMALPVDMVVLSEGRGKSLSDAAYLAVVEWIRAAGL